MNKFFSQKSRVAWVVLSMGVALYGGLVVADTLGVNAGSVWAQIKSLETQHKVNLAALDQQIASLRSQIQSTEATLKPLQAQRETIAKQFEEQRAALRDQVSPGY